MAGATHASVAAMSAPVILRMGVSPSVVFFEGKLIGRGARRKRPNCRNIS